MSFGRASFGGRNDNFAGGSRSTTGNRGNVTTRNGSNWTSRNGRNIISDRGATSRWVNGEKNVHFGNSARQNSLLDVIGQIYGSLSGLLGAIGQTIAGSSADHSKSVEMSGRTFSDLDRTVQRATEDGDSLKPTDYSFDENCSGLLGCLEVAEKMIQEENAGFRDQVSYHTQQREQYSSDLRDASTGISSTQDRVQGSLGESEALDLDGVPSLNPSYSFFGANPPSRAEWHYQEKCFQTEMGLPASMLPSASDFVGLFENLGVNQGVKEGQGNQGRIRGHQGQIKGDQASLQESDQRLDDSASHFSSLKAENRGLQDTQKGLMDALSKNDQNLADLISSGQLANKGYSATLEKEQQSASRLANERDQYLSSLASMKSANAQDKRAHDALHEKERAILTKMESVAAKTKAYIRDLESERSKYIQSQNSQHLDKIRSLKTAADITCREIHQTRADYQGVINERREVTERMSERQALLKQTLREQRENTQIAKDRHSRDQLGLSHAEENVRGVERQTHGLHDEHTGLAQGIRDFVDQSSTNFQRSIEAQVNAHQAHLDAMDRISVYQENANSLRGAQSGFYGAQASHHRNFISDRERQAGNQEQNNAEQIAASRDALGFNERLSGYTRGMLRDQNAIAESQGHNTLAVPSFDDISRGHQEMQAHREIMEATVGSSRTIDTGDKIDINAHAVGVPVGVGRSFVNTALGLANLGSRAIDMTSDAIDFALEVSELDREPRLSSSIQRAQEFVNDTDNYNPGLDSEQFRNAVETSEAVTDAAQLLTGAAAVAKTAVKTIGKNAGKAVSSNKALTKAVTTKAVAEGTSAKAETAARSALTNPVRYEQYKVGLRREMARPSVSDEKLNSILDKVYRENAQIGSGSTAAAIRHEAETGMKVKDAFHTQKGQEMATKLERWLRNNPTASASDRAAAENVIKDTLESLGDLK